MKLPCPASTCRAENDVGNKTCVNCGIPLQEYFLLCMYPSQLFNQGLREARAGRFAHARDLFAAVVYWCPEDKVARNALATACLELGDRMEADCQWRRVLKQFLSDPLATQGLAMLAESAEPSVKHSTKSKRETRPKKGKVF